MENFIGIGIAVLAIVGGLGVAYYSLWLQSKARELKHRERMAMIDKGIAPPELMEPAAARERGRRSQRGSGVFMICMGIGIGFMMYLVNGPKQVWIGALIALFGAATLINALWDERDSHASPPSPISRPPNP